MTSQGQTKRTKEPKTKTDQTHTNHIIKILNKKQKVEQSLNMTTISSNPSKTPLTKCQVIKIKFHIQMTSHQSKCQCVGS